MITAVRVLTAVVGRRDPSPTDVEDLHRFAPFLADAPPDELACAVIQAMTGIGQFSTYDLSIVPPRYKRSVG
jgi:hypothetical protein